MAWQSTTNRPDSEEIHDSALSKGPVGMEQCRERRFESAHTKPYANPALFPWKRLGPAKRIMLVHAARDPGMPCKSMGRRLMSEKKWVRTLESTSQR